MDVSLEAKTCSFCGQRGGVDRQLIGGLGAWICFPCVTDYHRVTQDPVELRARKTPPWEKMSDAELLATLPEILRSADQVNEFAADWVALLRDRKVSWAAIGASLGVSRQAVWERFAKRVETRRATG